MIISPFPIVTPNYRVTIGVPVPQDSSWVVPADTAVLVALTPEQAADLMEEDRHADWICSLTERLRELVNDGAFTVEREWDVSGTATVTVTVSGTALASTQEQAAEEFVENVKSDISIYADEWNDALVDDVEVDHTERS